MLASWLQDCYNVNECHSDVSYCTVACVCAWWSSSVGAWCLLGVQCERAALLDWCIAKPCRKNGGTCMGDSCECPPHSTGRLCETLIQCSTNPCRHSSKCQDYVSTTLSLQVLLLAVFRHSLLIKNNSCTASFLLLPPLLLLWLLLLFLLLLLLNNTFIDLSKIAAVQGEFVYLRNYTTSFPFYGNFYKIMPQIQIKYIFQFIRESKFNGMRCVWYSIHGRDENCIQDCGWKPER